MVDVSEAINNRRAYRYLIKAEIDDNTITQLAGAAQLAPSCNNNQPWRYIFITDEGILQQMNSVYSRGNKWAEKASLVIVVYTAPELDCQIKNREYSLYDTGIASGFIMLRAAELNLVAHPIAGYSPAKVRKILNIPDKMNVINLIIVGKHDPEGEEKERPERLSFDEFLTVNTPLKNLEEESNVEDKDI
jgi:nitroreductase